LKLRADDDPQRVHSPDGSRGASVLSVPRQKSMMQRLFNEFIFRGLE